jgi:hypothetical protein
MGVIDGIGKIFQWRKELPTPIDYIFIPPRLQLLPKEIIDKLENVPQVCRSFLSIENMSNRVLKDIRIKIPVKLPYEPIVESSQYDFDRISNEIHISNIDPKECIYITIFTYPYQSKMLPSQKLL